MLVRGSARKGRIMSDSERNPALFSTCFVRETPMAKITFNPDGLPVPRGSYSLVNVAQPGRMVFIAGQTASDHDGKVVGLGDAKAQTRFILGKIQRAVEAAGGTINDVVALNASPRMCAIIAISTKPAVKSWAQTSRPAQWCRWWRWRAPSCCWRSMPSRLFPSPDRA